MSNVRELDLQLMALSGESELDVLKSLAKEQQSLCIRGRTETFKRDR